MKKRLIKNIKKRKKRIISWMPWHGKKGRKEMTKCLGERLRFYEPKLSLGKPLEHSRGKNLAE